MKLLLTNLQGRKCLVTTLGILYMNELISEETEKVATEIVYGKNHSIWVQESVDHIVFLQNVQAILPDVTEKSRKLPEETENPFPYEDGDREREWEIWSEGFLCTGDRGFAQFQGKARGRTFIDACDYWARMKNIGNTYRSGDGRAYLWGCRLYDNERDARKNFG